MHNMKRYKDWYSTCPAKQVGNYQLKIKNHQLPFCSRCDVIIEKRVKGVQS